METDVKRRNHKLTRILSFWYTLHSYSKELSDYQKQLDQLISVRDKLIEISKSVQIICNNEINLTKKISKSPAHLKTMTSLFDDEINEIKFQIENSKSPRISLRKNELINRVFEAYDENNGHNWTVGWYFYEFSKSFKNRRRQTAWKEMNLFLETHPTYLPAVMQPYFTNVTIKERVKRYLVFCKKNKVNPSLAFLSK
jgi:hypothetical protein